MKFCTLTLKVSAAAILTLISSGQVFCQGRVAGIVEEIRGTAYWKKDSKAKEIRLDPRHDQARILNVGEQVRSHSDGYLRLLLCDGEKTLRGRTAWFPVSVMQECPNRKAFDEYGRLGGRKRGEPMQVFSPANHSATTPGRFVIRWVPSKAKCTVQLAIKDAEGKSLWEEDDIDGNLGVWHSGKASHVLTRYRANGEEAPLLLRLTDSCANRPQITFSLLSVRGEAALQAELDQWDQNPLSLMVHLGRASAFESARMFSDTAEEYEAALKLAPESRHLLLRTIMAHRMTQNLDREEQLIKRLPSGTRLP